MTFRAREMGLEHAIFKNATGLYEKDQKLTVHELAMLTEYTIRKFPDYYPYYRQKWFNWNNVTQPNRNPLLLDYPGADGVMTGYTSEAGYGLVGSAIRNDRRLIVVIAGLQSTEDLRWEAQKLLDWGFRQLGRLGETEELNRQKLHKAQATEAERLEKERRAAAGLILQDQRTKELAARKVIEDAQAKIEELLRANPAHPTNALPGVKVAPLKQAP